MINKKWTIVLVAGLIAAAGAFASGESDTDGTNPAASYGQGQKGAYAEGRRGGGGPQGRMDGGRYGNNLSSEERLALMEERHAALLEEADTYKGSFTVVEEAYPALVDGDGNTWYLMIPFPIAEADVPAEGAEISVQAIKTAMSPVHLMVLEAEVDGSAIEPDRPEDGEWWRGMGQGGRMGGGGGGRGLNGPGYGWDDQSGEN